MSIRYEKCPLCGHRKMSVEEMLTEVDQNQKLRTENAQLRALLSECKERLKHTNASIIRHDEKESLLKRIEEALK